MPGEDEGWLDSASSVRASLHRPSFSPTHCVIFHLNTVFCRGEGTGVETHSAAQHPYPGSFTHRALAVEPGSDPFVHFAFFARFVVQTPRLSGRQAGVPTLRKGRAAHGLRKALAQCACYNRDRTCASSRRLNNSPAILLARQERGAAIDVFYQTNPFWPRPSSIPYPSPLARIHTRASTSLTMPCAAIRRMAAAEDACSCARRS
jgi:hypothetical protein